jgi:hypothetical protein
MPENSPAAVFAGIRYGQVIEEVIHDRVALGRDGIEWDFSPLLIPNPAGGEVAYLLIVSCRSLLLTAPRVAMCDIVRDSSPDSATLRKAVTAVLEKLYQARAELARGPGAIGAN